jgi:uncharacterized protein (DUF1697 family)
MRYVALLRGINVGGGNKIAMERLRAFFEALGYGAVSTYINSGNVLFESGDNPETISRSLEAGFGREFGCSVPILVKTGPEMRNIAAAIPAEWQNDPLQKTDVAYLFCESDSPETIAELPVDRKFLDIRYVRGAIFWNVERKNFNKSRLSKIAGHKHYRLMTVRNVNTARFLAAAADES